MFSRRKALQAITAGVVIGPKAIKEGSLVNASPPLTPYGKQIYNLADKPPDAAFDPLWKERQIRELTARSKGEWNEYELEHFDKMAQVRRHHMHLQSLKSVSPCAKIIMEQRLEIKETKEAWMEQAKRALRHLLEGKTDYDGKDAARPTLGGTQTR